MGNSGQTSNTGFVPFQAIDDTSLKPLRTLEMEVVVRCDERRNIKYPNPLKPNATSAYQDSIDEDVFIFGVEEAMNSLAEMANRDFSDIATVGSFRIKDSYTGVYVIEEDDGKVSYEGAVVIVMTATGYGFSPLQR